MSHVSIHSRFVAMKLQVHCINCRLRATTLRNGRRSYFTRYKCMWMLHIASWLRISTILLSFSLFCAMCMHSFIASLQLRNRMHPPHSSTLHSRNWLYTYSQYISVVWWRHRERHQNMLLFLRIFFLKWLLSLNVLSDSVGRPPNEIERTIDKSHCHQIADRWRRTSDLHNNIRLRSRSQSKYKQRVDGWES